MSPEPRGPEGGLIVDKPEGLTSHDVVAAARRALSQPRIGHTGTLDPIATGVLVLLLGRATRLAQFLTGAQKTYRAVVRFGFATDTYDAAGTPLGPEQPVTLDPAVLEAALDGFRGRYEQVPPPVSAKKVGGRRAYELARGGQEAVLAPVPVEVFDLQVVEVNRARATLRLTCSAGFYVRALAHALGERLGTGAHLAALCRERVGAFGIEEAVPLATLVGAPAEAAGRVLPMRTLLAGYPMVTLTAEGRRRAGHGQPVRPADVAAGVKPLQVDGFAGLVDEDGTLVGVARSVGGALHPVVVLM
ncbi:MAG TPA: tRNA pseudouridine(55) synthase TruB [Vicinamibacterales bacterium]